MAKVGLNHDAALLGSSYYDLPAVLRWFSGNIGIHHIHHLNSRIPYYRLPSALRDHPELNAVGRLTLWNSLKSVRLTLWCESRKELVSFKSAGRHGPLAGAIGQRERPDVEASAGKLLERVKGSESRCAGASRSANLRT